MAIIRMYQCLRYYLFNLLLANKTIFLCLLFLFPLVFKSILTIPLLIRNTEVILTLATATAVPMTIVNGQRETIASSWLSKQCLTKVVECCDILIECLSHLFSVTVFSNEMKILFILLYWAWIVEDYLIYEKSLSCNAHAFHSCLYFISNNNLEWLHHSFWKWVARKDS